ncbi:hypothetical protein pb186bvf_003082 [Paramecium bursaria]
MKIYYQKCLNQSSFLLIFYNCRLSKQKYHLYLDKNETHKLKMNQLIYKGNSKLYKISIAIFKPDLKTIQVQTLIKSCE